MIPKELEKQGISLKTYQNLVKWGWIFNGKSVDWRFWKYKEPVYYVDDDQ